MSKPLEGLRILDLTQFLSGPYCTMIFAGLGAEVIKIERPGSGEPARSNPPYAGPKGVSVFRQTKEDISLSILKRGRNKKGITLNLNSAEGKELFLKLVKTADVVMENFRPGTMSKLGLTYATLSEANPGIIYCSLTGFGPVGAYASLPAYDTVIQALGGAMTVNGLPDGPPVRSGIAVSDLSGGLFSCIGILAAIEHRRKTGKGQELYVSMMESTLSMMMDEAHDFWQQQGQPARSGSRVTRLTPSNSYKAKDGYFVICSGTNQHWADILTVMGRDDLYDDERYKDQSARIINADEVDAIINSWAGHIPVAEVVAALEAKGIPCAAVREIPEVYADKNLLESGAIVPVVHPGCGEFPSIKAAAFPIHFGLAESGFDQPAPFVGQDNNEIFGELLKLSGEEMEALTNKKII